MKDPSPHLAGRHWIDGGGEVFASHDPASAQELWSGRAAGEKQVEAAVSAAHEAFVGWSSRPLEARIECLQAFAARLRESRAAMAETISRETGKPLWESSGEVDSMIAKVAISIEAYGERRSEQASNMGGARAVVRYRPLGALAVFGPFNFPGHLPNGHIVPALLAGNTVIFKPSELTPLVARRTVETWLEAGLPPGALNLVQGARDTGRILAEHAGIDGILFTGSVAGGQALHRALAGHAHKLLALEMGGNNPLVVWQTADLRAAVYNIIQSAFLTSGQRCSCARRLIVPAGHEGERLIEQLAAAVSTIRVGAYTDDPEPFMGPLISAQAADALLAAQDDLLARGGVSILRMERLERSPAMLTPGLIDVTAVADREDREHFGPLLQVIRVDDFDAAIDEANSTAFGLCAGLLSDHREHCETFRRRIRAGVVNWNRPTTGASSRLPFGGIGLSGNHRPSGYFACDYCCDPVASLESESLAMPSSLSPGLSL